MKFTFSESSRTSPAKLQALAKRTQHYVAHVQAVAQTTTYAFPESSINLPTDDSVLKAIVQAKKALVSKQLKYIVVIGIGGSNLGTQAIYDAMYGSSETLEPTRTPKILFLDACDPIVLEKTISFLNNNLTKSDEILINIISKSGGTAETMVNADMLIGGLKKNLRHIHERIVVTTDVDSALWKLAEEQGFARLPIPDLVGGRFSVFSAVGLFPLAAAGIDIQALRSGASAMRQLCLNPSLEQNPALASAAILYAQASLGKSIHDTFVFHPQLESLGKWYRQLLGESIGKEQNIKGKNKHVGITPTVSIGSTDLHSVGQLYLGGPRNLGTTFLFTRSSTARMGTSLSLFTKLLPNLRKEPTPQELILAILGGVQQAYRKQHIPFMSIELADLSPKSLAEYMQFKMFEVMYLGSLFDINAFDQPHVELYKKETKHLLAV